MKTVFTLALLITSLTSSFAGHIDPNHSHVSVISGKYDIFYFKVDREFIGASIEVKNAAGEVIITDVVTNHKNILDFYFEAQGEYVITMKNGDETIEFVYNKVHPMPANAVKATAGLEKP